MLNLDEFVDLWGDDLKMRGFLETPTKEYFETLIIHFMNMGGLEVEEVDEYMKFVKDDALFNELLHRLEVKDDGHDIDDDFGF